MNCGKNSSVGRKGREKGSTVVWRNTCPQITEFIKTTYAFGEVWLTYFKLDFRRNYCFKLHAVFCLCSAKDWHWQCRVSIGVIMNGFIQKSDFTGKKWKINALWVIFLLYSLGRMSTMRSLTSRTKKIPSSHLNLLGIAKKLS